jgi:hypothetical protein
VLSSVPPRRLQDFKNPKYQSLHGIYTPNCGLDKICMSWGHDEYIYQVCVGNKCTLPDEALVRRLARSLALLFLSSFSQSFAHVF